LRFQSGGKDAEFWAGHFGAQMKDAHVAVSGVVVESVASFTNERKVPISIPFGTCVSDGVGQHLSFHGKVLSFATNISFWSNYPQSINLLFFFGGQKEIFGEWSNLSMQSVLPSRQFSRKGRLSQFQYGMRSSLDHEISYHGGSSLSISCKSISSLHSVQSATNIANAFPLFRTAFLVEQPIILEVIYLPSMSETIDVMLCCQTPSANQAATVVLPVILHEPLQEVPALGRRWQRRKFAILPEKLPGKMVEEIHLLCGVEKGMQVEWKANIGVVAMDRTEKKEPRAVEGLVARARVAEGALWGENSYDVVVEWKEEKAVQWYDVFVEGRWVGRTFTNGFVINGWMTPLHRCQIGVLATDEAYTSTPAENMSKVTLHL
jgi:hypothetical protein